MKTQVGDNSRVGNPRRKYSSLEFAHDALKEAYLATRKQYLEPSTPPSVIYHYCSGETMRSILGSGKLYAVNALTMEDISELVYAFEVVRPIVEKRENGLPKYFIKRVPPPDKVRQGLGKFRTYISCLSADAAIPSQWRKPGDQSRGCAIGFGLNATRTLCEAPFDVSRQIPGPFRMLYDRPTQEELVERFLEGANKIALDQGLKPPVPSEFTNQVRIFLMSLLMALKNPRPDFVAEREWRVLGIEDGDPLPFEHGRIGHNRDLVKLPICTQQTVVEVVLGSKFDQSIDAVQSFLVGAGFSGKRVRRSDVVLS